MHLFPKRRDALLTQPVGDETIVYDETAHKAFCLNAAAAAIWHRCDRTSTASEAAAAASRATGTPVAVETALLTLTTFEQEGLLEAALPAAPAAAARPVPDLSRRRVVSGLGTGVALLVPGIFALATPRPAEAYTCVIRVGTTCIVKGNAEGGPQRVQRSSDDE